MAQVPQKRGGQSGSSDSSSYRLISRHCHVSHAQMHADFKGPNPGPYSGLVSFISGVFDSGHVHILWTSRHFFCWKSKFLYRYRPEGIFSHFFRPDSGPPPPRYTCFYSEKRQIHLYRPFFPHCMAFLEKRGGLVPVYVFLFPVLTFSNDFRYEFGQTGKGTNPQIFADSL